MTLILIIIVIAVLLLVAAIALYFAIRLCRQSRDMNKMQRKLEKSIEDQKALNRELKELQK